MKMRHDGHIACEVYIYVDDGRIVGWSEVLCWEAARRLCSILVKLGIQDASRKRTSPSMTPGPWAGSVVHTSDGVVMTVTTVKWEKTRDMICRLEEMEMDNKFPHTELTRIRGFLIYVARTYLWMTPYLKGLHLTIDHWRAHRDKDGYKIPIKQRVPKPIRTRDAMEWDQSYWEDLENRELLDQETDDPPEFVEPVPRLKSDIAALRSLTSPKEPAITRCRTKFAVSALYLMGDASGHGFGSGLWTGDSREGVWYESANWASQYRDESSNWKEASNLVLRIDGLGEQGRLTGAELFVVTDNMVFGGYFYRGYSSSKKLNDLILRLRLIEMKTGCIIHVIHVAGTRMKASGIDGLSWGDLLEGMMAGRNPLEFIPLNEGAAERVGPRLEKWIESWWNGPKNQAWCGQNLRRLKPDDWFELRDIDEPRLWMPPPAAMETVAELFNEDRLAFPQYPHVFAVPRLMTKLWRKALSKDADVMFEVKAGTSFWPKSMHEPLTILIILPLAHDSNYSGPWTQRGSEAAIGLKAELETGFKNPSLHGCKEFPDLDSSLHGVRLCEEEWSRSLLWEFLKAQRSFPPVSRCLVRKLLPTPPSRSVSSTRSSRGGRRKRRSGHGGEPGGKVPNSKRRRSSHGDSL